jgi:hypothetical protein
MLPPLDIEQTPGDGSPQEETHVGVLSHYPDNG